jgi:hypothetical protein
MFTLICISPPLPCPLLHQKQWRRGGVLSIKPSISLSPIAFDGGEGVLSIKPSIPLSSIAFDGGEGVLSIKPSIPLSSIAFDGGEGRGEEELFMFH